MKNFPHLPAKSCSIKMHYRMQMVPWVLFIVLVALLSGAVMSFATVAWFLDIQPNDHTNVYRSTPAANLGDIDQLVQRQTLQRTVSIYDSREKTAGDFYNADAFLRRATVLSSDGWAVMYMPHYRIGTESTWDVFDYQGQEFEISRVRFDGKTGLVYFKLDYDGFRVVSINDWRSVSADQTVWTLGEDDWLPMFMGEAQYVGSQSVFLPEKSQYEHKVSDNAIAGDIVFDAGGSLMGLVNNDFGIIPGWEVQRQLSSILADSSFQSMNTGLRVHKISQVIEDGVIRPLSGLYVDSSPTRASSSTIAVGDVILSVNGVLAVSSDLSREIVQFGANLSVILYRNGEGIEIQTSLVD